MANQALTVHVSAQECCVDNWVDGQCLVIVVSGRGLVVLEDRSEKSLSRCEGTRWLPALTPLLTVTPLHSIGQMQRLLSPWP